MRKRTRRYIQALDNLDGVAYYSAVEDLSHDTDYKASCIDIDHIRSGTPCVLPEYIHDALDAAVTRRIEGE